MRKSALRRSASVWPSALVLCCLGGCGGGSSTASQRGAGGQGTSEAYDRAGGLSGCEQASGLGGAEALALGADLPVGCYYDCEGLARNECAEVAQCTFGSTGWLLAAGPSLLEVGGEQCFARFATRCSEEAFCAMTSESRCARFLSGCVPEGFERLDCSDARCLELSEAMDTDCLPTRLDGGLFSGQPERMQEGAFEPLGYVGGGGIWFEQPVPVTAIEILGRPSQAVDAGAVPDVSLAADAGQGTAHAVQLFFADGQDEYRWQLEGEAAVAVLGSGTVASELTVSLRHGGGLESPEMRNWVVLRNGQLRVANLSNSREPGFTLAPTASGATCTGAGSRFFLSEALHLRIGDAEGTLQPGETAQLGEYRVHLIGSLKVVGQFGANSEPDTHGWTRAHVVYSP